MTAHSRTPSGSTPLAEQTRESSLSSSTTLTSSRYRSFTRIPDLLSVENSSATTSVPPLATPRTTSHRHTSSIASVSSQPVLVRTHSNENHSTGMTATRSTKRAPRLPSIDQFSFGHILQAVELDIHDDMDAIAAICAKSKMSSADSYGAHLPPLGEITDPSQRRSNIYGRIGTADTTLSAVPEASSSSERLASPSADKKKSLPRPSKVINADAEGRQGDGGATQPLPGPLSAVWNSLNSGAGVSLSTNEPVERQIVSHLANAIENDVKLPDDSETVNSPVPWSWLRSIISKNREEPKDAKSTLENVLVRTTATKKLHAMPNGN